MRCRHGMREFFHQHGAAWERTDPPSSFLLHKCIQPWRPTEERNLSMLGPLSDPARLLALTRSPWLMDTQEAREQRLGIKKAHWQAAEARRTPTRRRCGCALSRATSIFISGWPATPRPSPSFLHDSLHASDLSGLANKGTFAVAN